MALPYKNIKIKAASFQRGFYTPLYFLPTPGTAKRHFLPLLHRPPWPRGFLHPDRQQQPIERKIKPVLSVVHYYFLLF